MSLGTLFIVSAPSGAGKTSLVKALLEQLPDVVVSVSHTTRRPRPGERDGVDYHFIDRSRFEALVAAGEFLEYARVFDHYYGTGRGAVAEQLAAGRDVILEIDWQGARQVREKVAGAVGIFIVPPSRAVLRERLTARAQDSAAVIERRMRDATSEIAHHPEYDYLLFNDSFQQAVAELRAVFVAHRLRLEVQQRRHGDALRALLAD